MQNTLSTSEVTSCQSHFPIQVVDRALKSQYLEGTASSGLQLMLDHFASNWRTQLDEGHAPSFIVCDIDKVLAAMIQIRQASAKQIEAWDPILSATSQILINISYYVQHLPKEFDVLVDRCETWLSSCRPYVDEPYGTSPIDGRLILKEAVAVLDEITKTIQARAEDIPALEIARKALSLPPSRSI